MITPLSAQRRPYCVQKKVPRHSRERWNDGGWCDIENIVQYAMLQYSAQLFVFALVFALSDFLCEPVIL